MFPLSLKVSRRGEADAYRAAAIYTLIGTAKLNGVDPAAYLRFVLERIADHPIKKIHELLPWNFAGNEQVQARPAA